MFAFIGRIILALLSEVVVQKILVGAAKKIAKSTSFTNFDDTIVEVIEGALKDDKKD